VKCLDSLVNQTLADIEIICINDASPDNGIEILRRYEREHPGKVLVIDLPENQRQGGARNEGMMRARGEYIGFVDPDDWVALNMYESLYTVAHDKDADIVSSKLCRTETRGDVKANPLSGVVTGGRLSDEERENIILFDGVMVLHSIYRRRLIIDNGLMFPRHLIYEDMVWSPIVKLYAESMYQIDREFYFYWLNPESGMHKRDSKLQYDRLKVFPMLITEVKKRGLYERFKDALDYRFICMYYISPVFAFVDKMSEVELDKLYEMRLHMCSNMPDYRKNRYLIQRLKNPPAGYVNMALMEIDPELVIEYMKTLVL